MAATVIGNHWLRRSTSSGKGLASRESPPSGSYSVRFSPAYVRLCDQFGAACLAVSELLPMLIRGNPTVRLDVPRYHLVVAVRPADPAFASGTEVVHLLADSSSPRQSGRRRIGALDDDALERAWEVACRGAMGALFVVTACAPGLKVKVSDLAEGVRQSLLPCEIIEMRVPFCPWLLTPAKAAEHNSMLAAALGMLDLSNS